MVLILDNRRRAGGSGRPAGSHRSFLRRPTTIAAALILAGSAVAAAALQGGGGAPVAATIGSTAIPDSAVQREVVAIQGQPAYEQALSHANTMALAAPVDPKAVATAAGDPDDLRISLVPVGGASTTRAYTTEDLQASVLTRLMYVAVLRQILAARHVTPTAQEMTDGLQQARIESGYTAGGTSLFDRLPSWYQKELAERGADVEALEHALVGNGGITPAAVEAAYVRRLGADFTTVCLRSAVVPATAAAAATGMLTPGGTGARDDGCAPMAVWAPDVQAAVRAVPVGGLSRPVQRGARVAVLMVVSRQQLPLQSVQGNVEAQLSSRYTDLVNATVEDEMALVPVTVAPQYGTYNNFGTVHGVLPPDALTPPAQNGPSSSTPEPKQLPDPFD